MKNPIVIDPPGFDQAAGWQECQEYVEQCGGIVYDNGEPNWCALFGLAVKPIGLGAGRNAAPSAHSSTRPTLGRCTATAFRRTAR